MTCILLHFAGEEKSSTWVSSRWHSNWDSSHMGSRCRDPLAAHSTSAVEIVFFGCKNKCFCSQMHFEAGCAPVHLGSRCRDPLTAHSTSVVHMIFLVVKTNVFVHKCILRLDVHLRTWGVGAETPQPPTQPQW
jgi:hypothetical protein